MFAYTHIEVRYKPELFQDQRKMISMTTFKAFIANNKPFVLHLKVTHICSLVVPRLSYPCRRSPSPLRVVQGVSSLAWGSAASFQEEALFGGRSTSSQCAVLAAKGGQNVLLPWPARQAAPLSRHQRKCHSSQVAFTRWNWFI